MNSIPGSEHQFSTLTRYEQGVQRWILGAARILSRSEQLKYVEGPDEVGRNGRSLRAEVAWTWIRMQGDDDPQRFDEAFCGIHEDFKDYATELFDELYMASIPDHIASYIDYDRWANDLILGGDYWFETLESGADAVFRNI